MSWNGLKNGELLKSAVENGFDILITSDKNLQYQHNLNKIDLAIIVLDLKMLKWDLIEVLIPKIIETIPLVNKGKVYIIK